MNENRIREIIREEIKKHLVAISGECNVSNLPSDGTESYTRLEYDGEELRFSEDY